MQFLFTTIIDLYVRKMTPNTVNDPFEYSYDISNVANGSTDFRAANDFKYL